MTVLEGSPNPGMGGPDREASASGELSVAVEAEVAFTRGDGQHVCGSPAASGGRTPSGQVTQNSCASSEMSCSGSCCT